MRQLSADHLEALRLTPMSARPGVYARLTLDPSGHGDDADNCPVWCDAPGCNAVVPLCRAYSPAVVVIRYAGQGVQALGCNDPSSDSGQHFGCSPEHAEAAMLYCWQTHIKPAHLQRLGRLNAWADTALPAADETTRKEAP